MIPYEPFPYQWERRYKELIDCRKKYGLCGLMESHHYGFYPSFVSEFAKTYYFEDSKKSGNTLLPVLARLYEERNVEKVDNALRIWSDTIREYVVSGEDQYGPFRIGPAYPICYMKIFNSPESDYAHFGTRILNTEYNPYLQASASPISSPGLRNSVSVKQFAKMEKMMDDGISILESIENPNDDLLELIDLGKFIKYTVHTAINVKQFNKFRVQMDNVLENKSIEKCLNKMEEICRDEIEKC